MPVAELPYVAERVARPADGQEDQRPRRAGRPAGSNDPTDWCSRVSIQIRSLSPRASLKTFSIPSGSSPRSAPRQLPAEQPPRFHHLGRRLVAAGRRAPKEACVSPGTSRSHGERGRTPAAGRRGRAGDRHGSRSSLSSLLLGGRPPATMPPPSRRPFASPHPCPVLSRWTSAGGGGGRGGSEPVASPPERPCLASSRSIRSRSSRQPAGSAGSSARMNRLT